VGSQPGTTVVVESSSGAGGDASESSGESTTSSRDGSMRHGGVLHDERPSSDIVGADEEGGESSHQEAHMVAKRVLVPARVRRPPREGFSWIDRHFLRDHASGLSRDAILLYFFLVAVSDKSGLSFWSDATIAARLQLDIEGVGRARQELVGRDLVAHGAPLTQVLALPELRSRPSNGQAEGIGAILRRLSGSP
jgi:Helix-turn-helix domain